MDESLWPARNVAEYAYCPRLFYYMEVEGIHVPSEDTAQGNRVHRRVDRPSMECLPDGSPKAGPESHGAQHDAHQPRSATDGHDGPGGG